jgi:hypothetical protein
MHHSLPQLRERLLCAEAPGPQILALWPPALQMSKVLYLLPKVEIPQGFLLGGMLEESMGRHRP